MKEITAQEIRILNLTSEGLTAMEVGVKLNLSRRTVEKYLELIREKLECKNKVQMLNAARKEKLIK